MLSVFLLPCFAADLMPWTEGQRQHKPKTACFPLKKALLILYTITLLKRLYRAKNGLLARAAHLR